MSITKYRIESIFISSFYCFLMKSPTVDLYVPIVPIPDLKISLGLPAPISGDANAGMRLV